MFYADYGNSERVKRNRLAALPAGCGDLPPQAFKFNIALLVPPPGGYADDARAYVEEEKECKLELIPNFAAPTHFLQHVGAVLPEQEAAVQRGVHH